MDLVSLEIPSTLCTQARQCTKVRFDKFLSGENLNFVDFIHQKISSQLHCCLCTYHIVSILVDTEKFVKGTFKYHVRFLGR